MALRSIGVKLIAEVSGYTAGLKAASKSTQDFVGQLDRAAKAGKLDAVANQAKHVGLGLVALAGTAIYFGARFDKAMSSVSAATHASADDLNKLREAALQAGKDTAFSATEAASGIEELAKAGVSTADILGGGLTGALSLAAAGQIDVGEAAETAASAMTQFKLSGKDVGHVADLLAAGAGKAQGSVHDLGMALSQGGLVASQMGLSIEEATGTLAAFASAGLLGSDAGTSLKTALIKLSAPSAEASSLMEKLGIHAFDASGSFVGMAKFAGILRDSLSGLTQEQRNAALATIFGTDAIRSASILYEQGQVGIQGWIDKTNDTGYAADTAARKMDNLAGDVERLKGSLETLAIESSSGANKGLRFLAQTAESAVNAFADMPPVIGSTTVVLAAVGGASLLAFSGFIKMKRAAAEALDELRQMGPVGVKAASGLETAGKWAGRASIALAALEVAMIATSATATELNVQVEALGKGLTDWGKGGQLAGESARVLGGNMEDLRKSVSLLAQESFQAQTSRAWQGVFETVIPGLKNMDNSLAKSRERVQAVDQALADMVKSGSTQDAAAAFQRIAAEMNAHGISTEKLLKLLPEYRGAVEVAGSSSATAAEQVGEVGRAADATAQAVDDLKKAFNDLFDAYMGIDRAQIKLVEQTKETTAALKAGKHNIDLSSESGRKHRAALLDQVDALNDVRQAEINSGAPVASANAKFAAQVNRLIDTAVALGYTRSEVVKLLGKYGLIPKAKSTNIKTNAPQAKAKVDALDRALHGLRDQTVHIDVVTSYRFFGKPGPGGGLAEGGIFEHAQYGKLREAAYYSPVHPGRYMIAEPQTGGEAFIPKRGPYDRAMTILSAAAGWYGSRVVPMGRGGDGAAASVVNLTFVGTTGYGRSLVGEIQYQLRSGGLQLKVNNGKVVVA